MYSRVLTYSLIVVAVIIALHLVLSLLSRRPIRSRTRWNYWEMLVYLGLLGSVGVLGVTAFSGFLRVGTLNGWLLFIHMFGAGAFVAVLPLIAATWCEPSRFRLAAFGSSVTDPGPAPRFSWLPKLMFWVLIASGFVVTMTMLLSMLPLFGTHGLEELLAIHRYSGLVVVIAVVLHFYSVLLQRLTLR